MKKVICGCTTLLAAAAVFAQAPPMGGGAGNGWFGGGPNRLGMMGGMPGSRTPVTGAPYSAVQTTQFQQVLQGGNQIQRENQAKVYRDSQGRVRRESTFSGPSGQTARTIITIYDPVAGYLYNLNPQTKTAFQTAIRTPNNAGGRGAPPNRPNRANVQTQDLGTQTINGVVATGTRTTVTIPAGAIGNQQPIQIVRETWESQALRVPVLIKSSDPRFGTSMMQLTNIVQTEPDPSLFQVPAGYTIRTGPARRGVMRGPMRMRPNRPVQ